MIHCHSSRRNPLKDFGELALCLLLKVLNNVRERISKISNRSYTVFFDDG